METIIKKAIEGGYPDIMPLMASYAGVSFNNSVFKTALLDSKFWECLGKACGWKDMDVCPSCQYPGLFENPQYYALRFHEVNLTKGFTSAVEMLINVIE